MPGFFASLGMTAAVGRCVLEVHEKKHRILEITMYLLPGINPSLNLLVTVLVLRRPIQFQLQTVCSAQRSGAV